MDVSVVNNHGKLSSRPQGSGCVQPLPNGAENGVYMGVSENSGTPKSSIPIGFSIINHPFWGPTPIFGNIHMGTTYPSPTR